ncbi:MAG: hypothetical protein INR64_08340, partial [Caulobacteraceae bacterium]|nr:hypothetical protein [Caulobacter sp.]
MPFLLLAVAAAALAAQPAEHVHGYAGLAISPSGDRLAAVEEREGGAGVPTPASGRRDSAANPPHATGGK